MDQLRKLRAGVAAGKARINKMKGDLESEDTMYESNSLRNIEVEEVKEENWNTLLVSCGSNAFSQISSDAIEWMSTSLKLTPLPDGYIHHISCGTNISSMVITPIDKRGKFADYTECYVWGNGLPGPPLKIPTSLSMNNVRFISCGQSHAAVITDNAKLYTWGQGDNGMLGHGNKLTINEPKLVTSINHLLALSVSCGAYHTAVVACEQGQVTYVKVPSSPKKSTASNIVDRFKDREQDEEVLECGQLYTFGLNKAGQLGLGNGSGSVTTPQWVAHLHTGGHKVAKVSCGFHHTMIIAVPIHAIRVFQTALFTCGWGEHGRLGLGDEDERLLPTMVKFATPFHPLHISAGEQHSLASGKEGCYSWGSNTMGQLGIGNPSITEFALTPTKIPLPEGMMLAKIAAGGRHSAGITQCGKVLAWGWGEEGQLGHGSEKNTYLPRPCRVPRVKGKLGHPIDIALGMSHTIVTVKNNAYVEKLPTPIPSPVKVAIVEPPPIVEEVKEVPPIEVYEEEIPLPEVVEEEEEEVVIREPSPEPQEEPLQELQPEPEPVIVAIRSIKELLEQRLQREEQQVLHAIVEEEPPVEIQEKVVEQVVETVFIEPEVEPAPLPVEPNNVIKLEPIKKPVEDKYKIYYKDGQNYDNCLIANSAKRAEMRRLKKLQQQGK